MRKVCLVLGCGLVGFVGSAVAAPGALAAPATPGAIDPAPLLARHRQAVGGEAAIARARRMRLKARTTESGLDGTATWVIDGDKSRVDAQVPALRAESIEVWDGKQLVERGWNGDVRVQGDERRALAITLTSLRSLGYLREPATRIAALPPLDEGGTRYDRLTVEPPGGKPAELWLRPDGLVARILITSSGRPLTWKPREYGKFGGLLLPKVIAKTDPGNQGEDIETVDSVEWLDKLDAATFAPPEARPDLGFPPNVSAVTVPVGQLLGRFLAVTGTVGGKTCTFLLDTGASTSVFDEDFLASIGAPLVGGAKLAGGHFAGYRFARVPELNVSGMRVGPQVGVAIPLQKTGGFPLPVDGVLGYDFFSRFATTIDYAVGTISFRPRGSYTPDEDDVAVPFQLDGTAVLLPVKVNGRDAGWFQLDTGNGAESSIHHIPGAEALIPKSHPLRFARGLVFGSGEAAAYTITADLSIGTAGHELHYPSAPVSLLDPKDKSPSQLGHGGNLGQLFLRPLRVTLDYGKSMAYFHQKRPFKPSSIVGVSGMTLKWTKAGFAVEEVAKGWPAAKAGLQPDDLLISVAGLKPVPGNTGNEDWSPGEARKIVFSRGGVRHEVTVVAARHP